jgi:hypothetical protein
MAETLFPPMSLDAIRHRIGESRRRIAELARELADARGELAALAGASSSAAAAEPAGEAVFDEGPTRGDISEGELKFEAIDLFVTEKTKT